MFTMTQEIALAEIARRATNKVRANAGLAKVPPAFPELRKFTGPDLRDAVELLAPKAPAKAAPAKPAKVTRAQAAQAAKAAREKLLRAQAWEMRQAAKAEGRKLTYAQACAQLGVAPAKASK